MDLIRNVIGSRPIPQAAQLIGYIDHHPNDHRGGAVIQFGDRPPVLWDGDTTRSLPSNWRDRCKFDPA